MKLGDAIPMVIGMAGIDVGVCISGPRDSWEEMAAEWAEGVLQESREADNYTLTMPCGQSMAIRTVDDMPCETVPCPCRDPGHYLVMYTEPES